MQVYSRQPGMVPWRGGMVRRTECRPQSGHGFLGQLDWMLGRLSAAHIRITLVRVVLPNDVASARVAERLAEELDDSYGLAGMLADGSVMAAFFGPRQPGAAGDRQQTRAIVDRLGQVLRDIGITPDAARAPGGASVFLIHRWTDEVGDVNSLMLDAITSVRAEVARLDLLPA